MKRDKLSLALCNFSIDFTGKNPDDLIKTAKTEIEKKGGQLNGDTTKGDFTIPSPAVDGSYTIAGSMITFIITKKPFGASCNMIEKRLREYLQS